MSGVIAETVMPTESCVASVADPGAARATIEVPDDTADSDTPSNASDTSSSVTKEAAMIMQAPGNTAGTAKSLFLCLPFTLGGVICILQLLMSVTDFGACCCSLALLFHCKHVFYSLLACPVTISVCSC